MRLRCLELKARRIGILSIKAGSTAIPDSQLRLTEQGRVAAMGGAAIPVNGLVNTVNATPGAGIGKSPIGEWEFALPNTEEMKDKFKNEEIKDILFVITFGGTTPEWPS